MTAIRDKLTLELFRGRDPWKGLRRLLEPHPIQGWNSNHPWLRDTVTEHKPSVAVEIGAWKGASVGTMAHQIATIGLNSVVIAVDTWLGSSEHWMDDRYAPELQQLYHEFMQNMAAHRLTDYVIPVRLDSLNAARLLRRLAIHADLIHLDAGHDYHSVNADLNAWWPVLQDGGVLLCDDYWRSGQWPEVKQAIDDFLPTVGVTTIEAMDGKCRVRKIAA